MKRRVVFFAAGLVLFTAQVFAQTGGSGNSGNSGNSGEVAIPVTKNRDLVIKTKDVSETAAFYPVDVDGTRLEVLAVRAPDGTVRTAFNTCQVCYRSGRGYYKQQGTVLVCQNCGNRFRMSQVEKRSGGCNPVPIAEPNKKVTESEITVPLEFLRKAKALFANWKRG